MFSLDCGLNKSIMNQQNIEFTIHDDNFIIRKADPKDFERIITLVNEAYWHYQQNYFDDSEFSRERINIEQLHNINNNANQNLLVLFDKTKNIVAGVILLEFPQEKSFAKFGLFAIDKSYKGNNLGREMISFVERYAKENNRNLMKIEVFTFAPKLASHYQSLGYCTTHKVKTFPRKDCIRVQYRNEAGKYLQKMIKDI